MPSVPTGTSFAVASAFSTSINITAITNASQAVVTTASAHTYTNGDFVEVRSGWGRLDRRVLRIIAASASTLTLEGYDTSNTTLFPAGAGVGSIRRVTTWAAISQMMNPQAAGGDPRNVTYRYTDNDNEFSINDGFAASSYTLELDADSNTTAGYLALRTLTEAQSDTVLRLTMRNGGIILQPCNVALNESVVFQDGQINRVRCVFNGTARVTRY